MSEQATMQPTTMPQRQKAARTPEEQTFIASLEAYNGRKMSEQEINLSIAQAKAIGEL